MNGRPRRTEPARRIPLVAALLMAWISMGCVTAVPAVAPDLSEQGAVVFGRILTVLLSPSSRTFAPKIGFFEIVNRQTSQRTRVDVGDDDTIFRLKLAPGDYEVSRVQIREGPFAALADLALAFRVGPEPLIYLGTWRIGVDAPQNNRQFIVSVIDDQTDLAKAAQQLAGNQVDIEDGPIPTLLPTPSVAEGRLYEVMPYPRVLPYYRRHW